MAACCVIHVLFLDVIFDPTRVRLALQKRIMCQAGVSQHNPAKHTIQ